MNTNAEVRARNVGTGAIPKGRLRRQESRELMSAVKKRRFRME